jgi:two-component system, NarL family, sensor kinase
MTTKSKTSASGGRNADNGLSSAGISPTGFSQPRSQRFGLGAVARFGLAGMAAVVAIGGLTLFAVSRISRAEALEGSRERARLAAYGIVEPILAGGPLSSSDTMVILDDVVQTRVLVLSDRVLRVKIWDATGRILYSDEPKLIGQQFAKKDDHIEVLRTGAVKVEEANTSAPENRYERDAGRLLEVYLPMRLNDGTQVVYEQYERYADVAGNSRRLLGKLALPFGAGLALLWLTQLPLARSMARRIRAVEEDRAVLLERAVTASERERERIAADLHDGVVQDLAGLSFELSAAVPRSADRETRQTLSQSADLARQAMVRLRTALVDLHPPSAHSLGLGAAIDELAAPLRADGVTVDISVDPEELPADTEALLFRVAQESLRNVKKHAEAKSVAVRIVADTHLVTMTISDNGRGFLPANAEAAKSAGHMGMELQQALVRRQGGRSDVRSVVGTGTVVTVELPHRRDVRHSATDDKRGAQEELVTPMVTPMGTSTGTSKGTSTGGGLDAGTASALDESLIGQAGSSRLNGKSAPDA